MSGFIEDFYYGNIEAQELSSELGGTLKKKLNTLAKSEEELRESSRGFLLLLMLFNRVLI